MKKLKGFTLIELIVVITMVLVVGLIFAAPIVDRCTEDTVIITVEDKAIKRKGDSDDKYLIYTDKGTFEITDSIAYWRWDSSDLYGKIKVGHTYECKVCGWRIPILSSYKNIIEATEVQEE
jgi:prepilin-type N-terminal cleavage/methylation domain-containing protein